MSDVGSGRDEGERVAAGGLYRLIVTHKEQNFDRMITAIGSPNVRLWDLTEMRRTVDDSDEEQKPADTAGEGVRHLAMYREQDRMLMATELLNARIREIMGIRGKMDEEDDASDDDRD